MLTTFERGASAEQRATRLLVREGYRIVECNARFARGELDIVAKDGDVLCFVEVRSRADASHGHAAEMIDRRKQTQVARVAADYLALRAPEVDEVRFDVVAITGDDELLIRDAFRG